MSTVLPPTVPREGDIRLVGGETEAEGRVEIYMGGSWGMVCDNDWDFSDASITCQQLGYPIAQRAFIGSYFQGTEQLPFHLDKVHCFGDEQRLADCITSSTSTDITCSENQTAGVRCPLASTCLREFWDEGYDLMEVTVLIWYCALNP